MTDAVPGGYRTVTPHMVVKDARAALDFYEKAFGAETVELIPMPGEGGGVMHASFRVGDSMIMLAEECPQGGPNAAPETVGSSTCTIHLYVDDVDAAFAKAAEAGCDSTMPVMDTFWGDRFGMLTDPFGHGWSVATHTSDPSEEEMAAGAEAFFAQFAPDEGACEMGAEEPAAEEAAAD